MARELGEQAIWEAEIRTENLVSRFYSTRGIRQPVAVPLELGSSLLCKRKEDGKGVGGVWSLRPAGS